MGPPSRAAAGSEAPPPASGAHYRAFRGRGRSRGHRRPAEQGRRAHRPPAPGRPAAVSHRRHGKRAAPPPRFPARPRLPGGRSTRLALRPARATTRGRADPFVSRPMPDDLPFQSLTELSHLLADGKTSSREIVDACLARIDALDGQLHAFVDVYRDDALRSRRHGRPRAPRRVVARTARRPSDRAEGPAAPRGTADDGGLEELARAHFRSHGDGGRAPDRGRHDSARQDAHGRVRVRRLGPQPADGRAVESVGHCAPTASRAARPAAPRSPSPAGSSRPPSDRTPAGRSAFPPRCAGSPASSRPTAS